MKKIKILSLFPQVLEVYLKEALLAKAIKNQIFEVIVYNLRDYSIGQYKSVDDSPFGGGDGMLIRADVLEAALKSIKDDSKKTKTIYLSPQGQLLTHRLVKAEYESDVDEVILICGRYAGVDQRFINAYVDMELSIGDYVLSGGELGAMVYIEAVSRLFPGVLGHRESAQNDSLSDALLEAPQYTRPQVWNDEGVPEVLLSGNHQKIIDWKKKISLVTTALKRPDLWSLYLKCHPQEEKVANSVFKMLTPTEKKNLGLKKYEA